MSRASKKEYLKRIYPRYEKAIEQLLMTEPTCTPWRTSEVERAASRDGTRMAALEFYWAHRRRRQSVDAGSGYPTIGRA